MATATPDDERAAASIYTSFPCHQVSPGVGGTRRPEAGRVVPPDRDGPMGRPPTRYGSARGYVPSVFLFASWALPSIPAFSVLVQKYAK